MDTAAEHNNIRHFACATPRCRMVESTVLEEVPQCERCKTPMELVLRAPRLVPVATLANVKDQDGGRSSRLKPAGIALGLPLGEYQLFLDTPSPPPPDVDELAQFIRSIDGKHELGAGALAEAIVSWLGRKDAPASYDAACDVFTSYFVRNYPGPDTLIHKPEWHAPRLFKAAFYAFMGSAQAELDRRNPTPPTPIPDGWSFARAGDEIRVTAPNANPGGMYVANKGKLEQRLLYALADAIYSPTAVPTYGPEQGTFDGRACRLAMDIGVAYGTRDKCEPGVPFYAFTTTEMVTYARAIAALPPTKESSPEVTVLRIPRSPTLDPVTVYLEEFGAGQGRASIVCYDQAWTCYWGGMACGLLEFISQCDEFYIAGYMLSGPKRATKRERSYAERIARAVIDAAKVNIASRATKVTSHA